MTKEQAQVINKCPGISWGYSYTCKFFYFYVNGHASSTSSLRHAYILHENGEMYLGHVLNHKIKKIPINKAIKYLKLRNFE